MNDHHNGKDVNSKKPDTNQDNKVLHFPTLAERDRMRREEQEKSRKAQKQQSKTTEPFLNIGKITPFVSAMLVTFLIVQIVVHVLLSPEQKILAFYTMGFVPGYFTGTMEFFPWYAPLGFLTHMLLHGGWIHLAFNSVMGLTLGMFFEKRYGTRTTAIFFVLCGIGGALTFMALNPFTTTPVIGASGGISGFFAAVLLMLFEQRQRYSRIQKSPWPIIAFWVVLMVVLGFIGGNAMAWQAHVGGFLTGAALYELLKKGKIRF